MSYSFNTQVGKFWIRPHTERTGRWVLGFEKGVLGSFTTPDAAARVVSNHRTGWYNWDRLQGQVTIPCDLNKWMREGQEMIA